MKNIAKHLPHYSALWGILIMGGLAFIFFSYDRMFQAGVAIAVAIAYIAWGTVHHAIHKDLHFSVFIEYLVIALLGLTIILSLIFRS